jgi:hypothetical protein
VEIVLVMGAGALNERKENLKNLKKLGSPEKYLL